MRRFLCANFGIVALTVTLAAGQQPAAQPPIGKPNPATQQQPQVRTGIGAANSTTQQSGTGTQQPAARHVQVQPRFRPVQTTTQPRVVPPRPAATPQAQPTPTPVATPAPTPAPTPVSLQPMNPSEMPPVPPQVTYRDGLLTVQALNSTLGSLLQTIRNKTGIQFEGAENAGERVAVSAGPAPEGEVLASIFNGSGYDYLVVGRQDDPTIVQRVILTPKARGGAVPGAIAQQPQRPQAQQELPEEEAPDEQVEPDQPQDMPAQPPQVTPPPTAQEQPKTPEQLLQELKEMQQKQQGQQPQPNQVPIKPPPR